MELTPEIYLVIDGDERPQCSYHRYELDSAVRINWATRAHACYIYLGQALFRRFMRKFKDTPPPMPSDMACVGGMAYKRTKCRKNAGVYVVFSLILIVFAA